MNFRHAFFNMLDGKAVKLPHWGGYWVWENGTIMIHTKEGDVFDIRKTTRPGYTFSNIADVNWEVCERIDIPVKKDEPASMSKQETVVQPIVETSLSETNKPVSTSLRPLSELIETDNKITLYIKNCDTAICIATIVDEQNKTSFYLGIGYKWNERKYVERYAEINLYENIKNKNSIGIVSFKSEVRHFISQLTCRSPVHLTSAELQKVTDVAFSALRAMYELQSAENNLGSDHFIASSNLR